MISPSPSTPLENETQSRSQQLQPSSACPALLFDRIKGFPAGTRVFTNAVTNPQRAALALGIDPTLAPCDGLKAWMEKRKTLTLRPKCRPPRPPPASTIRVAVRAPSP
jgi:hypothetical protein